MIAIALLVFIPACIYGFWRALPFAPTQRQGWAGVWRLACVIAVVRIGALGLGVLFTRNPDWIQSVGYVLLLVGLPEIFAAKSLRSDNAAWFVACCALLASSSVLWAALIRLSSRAPMKQADERPKI